MKVSQLRHANKDELITFLKSENVPLDENVLRDDLYALAVTHVKAKELQGLPAVPTGESGSNGNEGSDIGTTETPAPETAPPEATEPPPETPSEGTQPPIGIPQPNIDPVETPAPDSPPAEAPAEEADTFTKEDEGKPVDSPYAGMDEGELMIELRVLGFDDKNDIISHIKAYVNERTTVAQEMKALSELANKLEERKIALDKHAEDMEKEEYKLQVLAREQRYYLEEIIKNKDNPDYVPMDVAAIKGKAEIGAQKSLDARKKNREEKDSDIKQKKLDAIAHAKKKAATDAIYEAQIADKVAGGKGPEKPISLFKPPQPRTVFPVVPKT